MPPSTPPPGWTEALPERGAIVMIAHRHSNGYVRGTWRVIGLGDGWYINANLQTNFDAQNIERAVARGDTNDMLRERWPWYMRSYPLKVGQAFFAPADAALKIPAEWCAAELLDDPEVG